MTGHRSIGQDFCQARPSFTLNHLLPRLEGMSPESQQWPLEFGALAAAPQSHRLMMENEQVRVLEVIIQPGQTEPKHHHCYPSVMVVDQPANIVYRRADNSTFPVHPAPHTKTEWLNPEPLHAIENVDTKIYHAVRVELKR